MIYFKGNRVYQYAVVGLFKETQGQPIDSVDPGVQKGSIDLFVNFENLKLQHLRAPLPLLWNVEYENCCFCCYTVQIL